MHDLKHNTCCCLDGLYGGMSRSTFCGSRLRAVVEYILLCYDCHFLLAARLAQPQPRDTKYQSPWADKQYAAIDCNGPWQSGLSKIG